jgi:hypothetical protein
MALDLTPLESLPPPVEKVAGVKAPPPLRMMAARGIAPLKPGELATAIYQLHLDGDEAVKSAALKSAIEIPEKILLPALGEALDARVLDFFARRVWQKAKPIETLLLNKAVHDETFRHLATLCSESELELIAKNEERLLRTPSIIAALYLNPKCRMSTAQRAIELAVRNGVKVDGLAAFEEAAAAISGPNDDAAFKKAAEVAVESKGPALLAVEEEPAPELAVPTEEQLTAEDVSPVDENDEKAKRLTELSPAAQVRAATLGNAFARGILIRSRNKQVALACIKAPGVTDAEALVYATNRQLDDDIIRFVARKRQWTRLYAVKVALCNNPKCPLPTAMGFLPHLRPPELKSLGRSKGIPSALANAARNMLRTRSGDK